jgi:HK97 family phage portal protein
MHSELLGSDEILHVPLLTLDGYTALSPIKQNRLALNVAYQQQKFSERFYANGVKLSGVLEHPQKLSKEAGERLRENWTAAYAGAQNAGKVAILEEGMKFNALLMPLDDAQYIETAKLSREEIAGMFRIPPHMIGALDRATFSNIEQQSLEFAVYTLTPYLVKWEKALAETLLLPSMQDEFYFRFNMDALLRGDMKSRYEAYAQARQWGWLSANDILDLEDRNAIENGDIYLQPMNMIPAGTPVETYLKGATSAKSEGEKNAA